MRKRSTSAPLFLGVNCFRYEIFGFIWESCLTNSGKYLFFLNYQFSQWMAAGIIFLFSRFFSTTPDFSLWKVWILSDQPFQFFGQNHQKNHIFHLKKYLWQNFGIFPPIQKKSPVFDENGAKNKCLLLNIFFFLIFIA